jgi:hypothetical protein
LAQLATIWLFEQTVFGLLILVCCVPLIVFKESVSRQKAKPKSKKVRPQADFSKQPKQRFGLGVWLGTGVLVVVFIGVGVFLIERGDNPVGVRHDSWSDANILVSGRNYAREGLWAHWGAAQHQTVTDQHPSDPYFIYTKYPVASNLINGLWRIAGIESMRIFRLVPALCSLLGVVLWFRLYKRIAGRTVAVVAAMAMALSYGFLAYADNLHFHAYAMSTSVAAISCYLRAMEADRKYRLRWFLLTALLMFVTACFTWEYHLWMVIFIGFYSLLFKCPVRRGYLALLGLPLFLALVIQLTQTRLAFAGVEKGADEAGQPKSSILEDVYRRVLGFEDALDTPAGLTLSGYPKHVLKRYYEFYGLPVLGALAMLLVLLMKGRKPPWRIGNWPDEVRLLVVLLLSGVGWWLVMLQHTGVHQHVMRHGLAGYALLMALLWVRCWKTTWSGDYHLLARVGAGLLMLLLCYPQLEGLTYNLRMHYQENFRYARARNALGAGESKLMLRVKEIVPEGSVIITNHNRRPSMRFWTERPVYYGGIHRISRKAPKDSPLMVQLRYNHLRDLYDDNMPPLYFVFHARKSDLSLVFSKEPFFRFLLLGNNKMSEEAWKKAGPILKEAVNTSRTDESFCPIVGMVSKIMIFDMKPAIPALNRGWDSLGFPTLREFGQTR